MATKLNLMLMSVKEQVKQGCDLKKAINNTALWYSDSYTEYDACYEALVNECKKWGR